MTRVDARRTLQACGQGLLILLAGILPFEVAVFRAGPLEITTVELVMYATATVWGLRTALALRDVRMPPGGPLGALRREPMMGAALLWTLVVFASAAVAPDHRAAALKFALRTLSGVLVFLATRTFARSDRAATRVAFAILGGALLSACAAELEMGSPATAGLWSLFRGGSFDALGLRRASGVFIYPTIGAVYWEAALPLVILAPAFRTRVGAGARPWKGTLWAGLATALLIAAILASATRSAFAGGVLVCVALAVATRRWDAIIRRTAACSLIALGAASVLVVTLAREGSLLGQRLMWWHDDAWFGVEYEVPSKTRAVSGGQAFETRIVLHNTGTIPWHAAGDRRTRLAHHWYRREPSRGAGVLADVDGPRTELPADVPPGGVMEVLAVARAPLVAGRYQLLWDLVQEDVTWFSDRGNAMGAEPIVVPSAVDGDATDAPNEIALPEVAQPTPRRAALWRAALTLWLDHPLFGVGPDNFRREYAGAMALQRPAGSHADTRVHANSLYFETLADLGLLGVAALSAVILSWLWALRAHLSARRPLGLGVAAAAGVFFVHGVFDYFFEFTPTLGLFWMLLGLTSSREPSPSEAEGRRSSTT